MKHGKKEAHYGPGKNRRRDRVVPRRPHNPRIWASIFPSESRVVCRTTNDKEGNRRAYSAVAKRVCRNLNERRAEQVNRLLNQLLVNESDNGCKTELVLEAADTADHMLNVTVRLPTCQDSMPESLGRKVVDLLEGLRFSLNQTKTSGIKEYVVGFVDKESVRSERLLQRLGNLLRVIEEIKRSRAQPRQAKAA